MNTTVVPPHRGSASRRSKRALLSLLLIAAISLISILPVLAAPPASTPTAPVAPVMHKALVPAGVFPVGMAGVTLWHDYGSFGLYRITDAALSGMSAELRSQITVDASMDRILFDSHPVNTLTSTENVPALLAAKVPAGGSLYLVQFVGPIKQAWLDSVQATGASLVEYIANNAYLVWTDASARSQLDALVKDGNFVQYSAAYQPAYKLGPTIETAVLKGVDPNAIVPVTVQIYKHAANDVSKTTIARLAVGGKPQWSPILAFENGQFEVRAADLLTIARLPDVVWVGERFARELNDEVQGQILAGNLNAGKTGPSGTGYKTWLDALGFSQNPADYPIVNVTDDGLGNGTVTNGAGDVTLTRNGDGVTTRVAYTANCTTDASANGIAGHGHINTSIVGGYDLRAGFPFRDPNGYQRGQGINPYARVAQTKIFTNAGSYNVSNCGNTDTGVIKSEQDHGAQISTNSWGCSGCASTYDDSSQAYDVGVRDADLTEAGNQQLIYVFSAGNSGSGAATIGTPGNGKNMITVGASENYRPSDEDGSWTDGCAISSTGADNAMDVISFSSRGPAPGGRVKPEVIAPGTHIQGTASTVTGYDGSGVCDQYRPSGQTVFAASSGTSHSTPAVAGVASLVYYWIQNHYSTVPSPALTKAYLIAHPTYLTGVAANDTLPSNNQGYGMPNMTTAFDATPRYLLNQTNIFNNTGETWTWDGAVADPSKPLRIVMVYTDAAGAIGTSPQVNNLNLSATVNATTYLGNRFSGQWSTTGGSADAANNYEAIFLPAGTSGSLHLSIAAANIAGDGVPNSGDTTDQDFALVCYNCAQEPDFTLLVTPASLNVCAPSNAVYTVNIGNVLGYTDPVTLSVSGQPAGTTTNFSTNPVTPVGSSTLTIGNTGAASAGSYSLTVSGTATSGTHTATVGLNLYTAAAAAPTLVSPANNAVNQTVTPTFTWNAAAQAGTYDIQVATDSGFTNVVASATGLTGTSWTSNVSLNTNTVYYWHVNSANACSTRAPSPTWQFTTVAAPGDCGIGTTANVVFTDGFEAG
ncbi:MAG: S8 family serine peptidase, partial [Anaerolineae bacterium]